MKKIIVKLKQNYMQNKYQTFCVCFALLFSVYFVLFALSAQAVDLNSQVGEQLSAGQITSGFSSPQDPRVAAVKIIKLFLELIGTFFLILIAMGSFWYITARGEESKIEKATTTIRGAVIGILIIIMAYGITYFVSKNIQKAAGIRTSQAYNLTPST